MNDRLVAFAPLLMVSILLASGCASVTRGTHTVLEVNTTPAQAQVAVYRLDRGLTEKELKRNLSSDELKTVKSDNKGKSDSEKFAGPLIAPSPASFALARKGEYRVEMTKEGYETATVFVKNRVAGGGAAGMAGNVIVGGLIGAGVDAGTGAMLNLVPNPVEVTLEPAKETKVAAPEPVPEEVEEPGDEETIYRKAALDSRGAQDDAPSEG